MLRRGTTFRKIVLLILFLLLPLVVIYSYTNQVSVNVVEQELQEKNLKRLLFLTSQIDNIVDQLSTMSIIVSKDPSINELGDPHSAADPFNQLKVQEAVVQKLVLLSASSSWNNRLTIFMPKIKQAISSDYYGIYDDNYLLRHNTSQWEYIPQKKGDSYFAKKVWKPLLVNANLLEAEAVVEVRFSDSNLIRMLNDYKHGGNASPFLYKRGLEPIQDNAESSGVTGEIVALLDRETLDDTGHRIVQIGHETYMVNYALSKSLDWYVIDYLPLKQVMAPINQSRNLFYVSIVLMLSISLAAAVALYRQVQIPIQQLLRGVQKIQTGKYSHRLDYKPNNEFEFLFTKFNEMAEEIQHLLERVYMENDRFREAKLKHLQSQINPHFLSNCLFFIKNMIAIDDKQAATKMILSLAEYFRYITKLEHTLTSLQEEIHLVENYLLIQNLRIERFEYGIDIPEQMMKLEVPRLMIQPIVENTIVHGIEKSERYGIIQIKGEQLAQGYQIVIDDNGVGLSDAQITALQHKVSRPLDQEEGCGLWNVHQRLSYQFAQNSGLSLPIRLSADSE
ncbi:sensor histidine kinase [Gordoniibacillus kamchatkensis]|uniref:sensor histidine kinase n=1 Tax=Gordoniibacillus kamchatkensis TaxID=1590651 RepID=UPI00069632D0|nr:histidine kinase [Paenibacillus sp. VKM B-2647]